MKPSERILTGDKEHDTAPYLPRFLGVTVNLESILAYLDEEHERRQAWEAHAGDAIQKLELLARSPFVIASPHMSQADRTALLETLKATGATLLPPGCEVVATRSPPPIPCAVAMPAPDERVMFFAHGAAHSTGTYPSEWRAGRWKRWDRDEWEDDASSVGDEAITYPPERVTHWLPMPEVPT